LSLNTCFAPSKEIYYWEVECFARKLSAKEDNQYPRKMLYVTIVGYLATAGSLIYPEGSPADYIAQSAVMIQKRLNSITLTELLKFSQTAKSDKVGNKVCALLPHLPALHNHVEVMTCASEDPNRKDKVSDFFDLEMLPVPLAYADVFASLDKRIRNILSDRSEL